MSKKVKFNVAEKEFFVLKYRELNVYFSEFSRVYAVERTAIIRWCIKFDNKGSVGLEEIKVRTLYFAETLVNSVQDYLSKNYCIIQIVKKYNLSGDSVLRTWIKW